MTDASIKCNKVTLHLPLSPAAARSKGGVSDEVGGRIVKKNGRNYVLALDSLDLEIKPGERVGIIGSNGAGKTTLMRTLAGIYHPTAGHVDVKGRISCLFSPAIGLSSMATGRENIRLACRLYRVPEKRIPDIAAAAEEFSGLGPYLDVPISHYSAGMRTRLGLSIVTHLEPDILLIDEVFGTGDADFAAKSRARLIDVMMESRCLVFSSHSETLVRDLCDRAVLLKRGKILADGEVDHVLMEYKTVRVH